MVRELLDRKTLEKLTSTEGIIEVLCGIENVDLDNIEELEEDKRSLIEHTLNIDLVSNRQIISNLRRSMDQGNLAIINKRQLMALSLLYFGNKDDKGRYVEYVCPYTGEVYNLSDIKNSLGKADRILDFEHILPHSKEGGTVLFNAIPVSSSANSSKQDLHLLDWFNSTGSKYYQEGGVERLNNLVNYMLSAYDIAFTNYMEAEIDISYEYEEEIEEGIDEEDLRNDRKVAEEREKLKQIRSTPIEGYIPYLKQLINELNNRGQNIDLIISRLNELEQDGKIKDIDKYDKAQEVIEKSFNNLTNSINVDYVKLVNSIVPNDVDNIEITINRRLNNIETIIKEIDGKTMVDYYTSMKYMNEEDILYKDVNIEDKTSKDIISFIASIRLGFDGKVELFIEMLSEEKYTSYKERQPDEQNIFKFYNKVSYKDYENIEGLNTSQFWSSHQSKILSKLCELEGKAVTEEERAKYKKVRRAINEYEMVNKSNLNKRIEVFIEMLDEKKYTSYENGAPNAQNIFKVDNKVPYKGYENIEGLNTSGFWSNNQLEILQKLSELEQDAVTEEEREKYKRVRRAIDEYEMVNKSNLNKRIEVFIEMLDEKKYISYENGAPNAQNIFSKRNSVPFKGYENIEGLNTSQFWRNNQSEILQKLSELEQKAITEEEKAKYKRVRRAIDEYEKVNKSNLNKRIEVFIEMLSEKTYTSYKERQPDEQNIFKSENKVPYKGYENIEGLNTSNFWSVNEEKILQKLSELEQKAETEEEREKYKRVRRAIDEYEIAHQNGLSKRIEVFIEMLGEKTYTSYEKGQPDVQNIFKNENKVPFKGYENIEGLNTSNFWSVNEEKILQKLSELEQKAVTEEERAKYKRVRRAIDEYKMVNRNIPSKRIEVFIEMLSEEKYTSYENGQPNDQNIFKNDNNVPYKGYENIEGLNTSNFWSVNEEKILQKLSELEQKAETEEEREKYKRVRRAIDEYEIAHQNGLSKRIEVFIEMLGEKTYTSYEKGQPDVQNIFKNENKVPFKGYENIEGLNTSNFWSVNEEKILQKLSELEQKAVTEEERAKYKRVRRAIDEYKMVNRNIPSKRIEVFIEMLSEEKYTSYENGQPNDQNIFSQKKSVPYKGYENIEGLNTSQFWSKNKDTKIIPLLFFNQEYDRKTKQWITSEKDYTNQEYDKARSAVLTYLKINNINEYVGKLEQEIAKANKITKVVQEKINLVEVAKTALERLKEQEHRLIEENKELQKEYMRQQEINSTRRAM